MALMGVTTATNSSSSLRGAGWRCVGIVRDCARVVHCRLFYYGCSKQYACANGRAGILVRRSYDDGAHTFILYSGSRNEACAELLQGSRLRLITQTRPCTRHVALCFHTKTLQAAPVCVEPITQRNI